MYTTSGTCAFVYQGGTLRVLPSIAGQTTCAQQHSVARGLNAAGLAVGNSDATVGGNGAPTVWSQGNATAITLPCSPCNHAATAVNDNSEIAGQFFIYNYPSGPSIMFTSESGNSINNAGQVAGVTTDSEPAAYVYANKTVTLLPQASPLNQPLPAGGITTQTANAINNAGQIVGNDTLSSSTKIYPNYAFLYQDGQISDLNVLVTAPPAGLQLRTATAINDAGWIVANGTVNDDECPCVFRAEAGDTYPAAVKLYAQPTSIATGDSVTLSWTDKYNVL
jgi:probable HAF family extracellular repeat protein